MDGLLIWLQKYKYYFDTPNFNPEKWSQALRSAALLSKEPTPWYPKNDHKNRPHDITDRRDGMRDTWEIREGFRTSLKAQNSFVHRCFQWFVERWAIFRRNFSNRIFQVSHSAFTSRKNIPSKGTTHSHAGNKQKFFAIFLVWLKSFSYFCSVFISSFKCERTFQMRTQPFYLLNRFTNYHLGERLRAIVEVRTISADFLIDCCGLW